jgi:uncharacterized membrane protein YphA (DoxX/SURF4 family)
MIDMILKQGRLIFSFAIAAFGVENLVCAHYAQTMLPVIPWVPGIPLLGYLTGVLLLAAGVCIAANWKARPAALLLGIFFLVCVIALQISKVAAAPFDVGQRTVAFETLTMCGAALMLAGTLPAEKFHSHGWDAAESALIESGRYLFGVSAIVFGIDHFLVIPVIVSLVPKWIPGSGLFWTWLTALIFIAAGLSIVADRLARWGGLLMGLMFAGWVLVLHGPRVATFPRSHNPNEWSSALIALAVCGGSWIAGLALSHSRAASRAALGPIPVPARHTAA